MSTTSTIGAFCDTNAPGSTARRATKPLTGDVMMVFWRLMRSSSSRACDCVFCARARSSAAAPTDTSLRCRRASAWAAAAARRGFASARRWSWRARGRLRAGGSWPSPLRGGLGLLHLFLDLVSSILAIRWPRSTRSPSRTEMSCSRPAACGTTDTVWSPTRLPTTDKLLVDCGRMLAGASSTVSWPRPPPRAPRRRTAALASAAPPARPALAGPARPACAAVAAAEHARSRTRRRRARPRATTAMMTILFHRIIRQWYASRMTQLPLTTVMPPPGHAPPPAGA